MVCNLCRLFYRSLKAMVGKGVRIFVARVAIFVGGLCDYRVSSLVKTKSFVYFLIISQFAII